MNPRIRITLPLIITFFVLAVAVVAVKLFYAGGKIDLTVLMAANCLFFITSMIVFWMQYHAMQNSNPNVFIRSVMTGMIIKIFVCIGAVVAYYFLSRSSFNKPAVYLAMIVYIIFLIVEVGTIMKLNKKKNA